MHLSFTHEFINYLYFTLQAAAESRAQRAEADLEESRELLAAMTEERDALKRRVTVSSMKHCNDVILYHILLCYDCTDCSCVLMTT